MSGAEDPEIRKSAAATMQITAKDLFLKIDGSGRFVLNIVVFSSAVRS